MVRLSARSKRSASNTFRINVNETDASSSVHTHTVCCVLKLNQFNFVDDDAATAAVAECCVSLVHLYASKFLMGTNIVRNVSIQRKSVLCTSFPELILNF